MSFLFFIFKYILPIFFTLLFVSNSSLFLSLYDSENICGQSIISPFNFLLLCTFANTASYFAYFVFTNAPKYHGNSLVKTYWYYK